jgi:hypothetical protein
LANIDIENPLDFQVPLQEAIGTLAANSSFNKNVINYNGAANGTINIVFDENNKYVYLRLVSNVVINFTNNLSANALSSAFLVIEQANGGSHYATYDSANVAWTGGYSPSLNSANGGIDMFNFISLGATSNKLYGSRFMQV